jgi:hypothetical protein
LPESGGTRQILMMVDRQNPASSDRCCRILANQILTSTIEVQPELAKSRQIPAIQPESDDSVRTLSDSSGDCWISFFAVENFFMQAKRRKIFLKRKMILSKIF